MLLRGRAPVNELVGTPGTGAPDPTGCPV